MGTSIHIQPGSASRWTCWKRSLANLSRMGHCAPVVMQTLLDLSGAQERWPVRLSAGMPGGIGNTGFECGALTSSLVLLGLRHGLRDVEGGLPMLFDRGQALCRQFLRSHTSLLCREIRGRDRFPRHCIRPVCMAPGLFAASAGGQGQDAIAAGTRETYARLFMYWQENGFHCAHAVLDRLDFAAPGRRELLDATGTFLGGTLFMGLTCSAFTAGVMAVGLRSGLIENSPLKVVRMLYRMATGGDAFDEDINSFNRSMNTGWRMSKWFRDEFGSTQCRALTGCDFSTPDGVRRYMQSGCLALCRDIARKVADRVEDTLSTAIPP